jgi:protein TonB
MFEDSLIESQVPKGSAAKNWTIFGSTALQAAVALTLVVLPLLHPERLSFRMETPLVFTPPLPKPPAVIREVAQAASSSSPNELALPTATRPINLINTHLPMTPTDDPPALGLVHFGSDIGNDLTAVLVNGAPHGTGTSVAMARPEAPKRIAVSAGVSAGMLLAPIRPVYPAIAKTAGISGTVVIEAVISKTGTVESLHVMSGPGLLRDAALDAIRTARYRPYLLNGEATEILTTFTVNFKLGA